MSDNPETKSVTTPSPLDQLLDLVIQEADRQGLFLETHEPATKDDSDDEGGHRMNETTILQLIPAEPGWRACCYKVLGDEVNVVYEPVIGWALVERSSGEELSPELERRIEPVFMQPNSARPVIESDLSEFRLFALVAPEEDVDQDAVVAQIKEGLAERNQRWTQEDDAQ